MPDKKRENAQYILGTMMMTYNNAISSGFSHEFAETSAHLAGQNDAADMEGGTAAYDYAYEQFHELIRED